VNSTTRRIIDPSYPPVPKVLGRCSITSPYSGLIDHLIVFETRYVSTGNLAVFVYDADTDEPYCKLSENVPYIAVGRDEFVLKDWTENSLVANMIVEAMPDVFERTDGIAVLDYDTAEIWRVKR
jgi:hypothetical protein